MQDVLDRLVGKIATAQIDPMPSDNIYMENVFPDEIYAEILKRLPSDEDYLFIEHPDAVLPDGTKTRKLLDLADHTISRLKQEDQEFWRNINSILTSKMLQNTLVNKFNTQISNRFGNNVPELVNVPLLYRDYPGYFISEHPDAPFKVITLQFYFPKDESQLHLGTSFHQREGNQFRLLKTNLFKPNSAYAFVRTENSWHSVKRLGPHESIRNTLALTIYLQGHEYKSPIQGMTSEYK